MTLRSEKTRSDFGARVGCQGPDQPLQPGRFQAHAGVGHRHDVAARPGDGKIAPAGDIRAGLAEHDPPIATLGPTLQYCPRAVGRAPIDENDLVGRPRLQLEGFEELR